MRSLNTKILITQNHKITRAELEIGLYRPGSKAQALSNRNFWSYLRSSVHAQKTHAIGDEHAPRRNHRVVMETVDAGWRGIDRPYVYCSYAGACLVR